MRNAPNGPLVRGVGRQPQFEEAVVLEKWRNRISYDSAQALVQQGLQRFSEFLLGVDADGADCRHPACVEICANLNRRILVDA